jgi:hypothetical protein
MDEAGKYAKVVKCCDYKAVGCTLTCADRITVYANIVITLQGLVATAEAAVTA